MKRLSLILVLVTTILLTTACDGRASENSGITPIPVQTVIESTSIPPTKPVTIPTPAPTTPGTISNMPHEMSCTNGAILLTGFPIEQSIFNQVQSFTLLMCPGANGSFSIDPISLSVQLQQRHLQQPFRDAAEITSYVEQMIEDVVPKTDNGSFLILDGVRTTVWFKLYPEVKKTGPTA